VTNATRSIRAAGNVTAAVSTSNAGHVRKIAKAVRQNTVARRRDPHRPPRTVVFGRFDAEFEHALGIGYARRAMERQSVGEGQEHNHARDADREATGHSDRHAGRPSERTSAVPPVTQEAVHPGAHAALPHAYFDLFDAAQIEDGLPAGLRGRRAGLDTRVYVGFQIRANLVVQRALLAAAGQPSPEQVAKPGQAAHAPSSTRAMARFTLRQRASALNSRARPARVMA
jgi:hypothetical protein